MSKRGGQPGNNNPGKNKPWTEAIRKALLAEDGKRLRAIAARICDEAAQGNVQAMKEIGDRIEGKALQPISAEIDANVTVNILRFADSQSA